MKNIIWLALGYNNEILAMWTKSYNQNFYEWKRACKSKTIGAYNFYKIVTYL